MTVSIDGFSTHFKMDRENVKAALATAVALVQSGEYAKHRDGRQQQLLNAPSIDIFLWHASYWKTKVEDFDIVGLSAGKYYSSDDFDLFEALAPYVEAGSYINIETSDFQKFQWYFDGNTCIRKEGELDFNCSGEIMEAILLKRDLLPMMIGIHPELDKRIHEVLKG